MYKKANPKVRIKDIARLAGVSTGTVDRVLHNRGEVSEKTRKNILEIIQKMDYQPDIIASLLAARKPFKIALLIPQETKENPFWKYPLEGIEEGLLEIMQFGVLLDRYYFDYADRESFVLQSARMLAGNPQGVILAPVFTEESSSLLDKCNEQGIPVVLINVSIGKGSFIAFIGQDSLQSGMVAGRLMNYGFGEDDSDLLIVNFTREKGNQEHILKREEGFRNYYRSLSKNNYPGLKQINITDTNSLPFEKIIDQAVFSCSRKVKGIFVTNSRVFRVAKFLEQKGLKDIILIGYDLLEENKSFLRKGYIDFLISQKPKEQGFKSLMTFYHYLVLKKNVERNQYLPIDIITKENLEHYSFT